MTNSYSGGKKSILVSVGKKKESESNVLTSISRWEMATCCLRGLKVIYYEKNDHHNPEPLLRE